jgi:hypothetical protein
VDPTLDVLFKVISALSVPLSGVVYALWKALNVAWDRSSAEQQAHIARLEAQQATCRACSEARQQAYKDLLSTTIKVIEQNTDAQNAQSTLSELLKKLEEVRGGHVPKNA